MAKTQPAKIKTFGEKRAEQYEKDRFKLETGIKFTILEIPDIKELTDFSVALINGISVTGEPVKYYATGKAVVNQCRELLSDADSKGVLNEPISVTTVTRRARKINKDYVCFDGEVTED